MFETVEARPAEMYEQQDLSHENMPSDVHDSWSKDDEGNLSGFHRDERFWQRIEMHSFTPNMDADRTLRACW